jgi:hypothetical protein
MVPAKMLIQKKLAIESNRHLIDIRAIPWIGLHAGLNLQSATAFIESAISLALATE